MLEKFFALFISFTSSTVGAISGIGGGVIIKPMFDLANIGSTAEISFLTGCTVLVMALVSLLRCRNSGIVIDWKISPWLAAGSAVGGASGKLVFNALSTVAFTAGNTILAVQSALLVFLTGGVLCYLTRKSNIAPRNIRNPAVSASIGVVLGGLAAFLGIGGGPMNIIVLYYFFSMDAKEASLNSLFIISISQAASLMLALVEGKAPEHDEFMLLLMAAGGVSGALLGSGLLKKLPCRAVERIYAGVILIVFCTSIYNLVSAITQ